MILEEISKELQAGNRKAVTALTQQALDEGLEPAQILKEGLLAGMDVIGEQFKNNEVFVPEVMVAARAMKAGTEILKPLLAGDGVGFLVRVDAGEPRERLAHFCTTSARTSSR